MRYFEFVKKTKLPVKGNETHKVEREWRHIKTGTILVETITRIQHGEWVWTWHKWTDARRGGYASLKWWIRAKGLSKVNVQGS